MGSRKHAEQLAFFDALLSWVPVANWQDAHNVGTIEAAWPSLREQLRSGAVVAAGVPEGSHQPEEIPAVLWDRLRLACRHILDERDRLDWAYTSTRDRRQADVRECHDELRVELKRDPIDLELTQALCEGVREGRWGEQPCFQGEPVREETLPRTYARPIFDDASAGSLFDAGAGESPRSPA